MKLIQDFNKAKQALYDHVGFVEDYVVYAIEDRTEMVWKIEDDFSVIFSETKDKIYSDGDYYKDVIYTQRFYEKHVFRGAQLTMIIVDTQTDGNKFFVFFDNDKEIK